MSLVLCHWSFVKSPISPTLPISPISPISPTFPIPPSPLSHFPFLLTVICDIEDDTLEARTTRLAQSDSKEATGHGCK
ncbi:hypothetical protein [Laspinema olomoucense]|uniref:hypothetical protein n=1 Tax=Laspinema olomoucense TaxID=3231600 RepID=UPI0021BA7ED5|nr:hypothetical protein [Laspinema sp. D3c]MCT7993889.1 hypothetical protein [Laspinema sp. D3c]